MLERTVRLNGHQVSQLRKRKGWSQEILADKAEVSKRTIERIERGLPIYFRTAESVAEVLDSSITELIQNEQPVPGYTQDQKDNLLTRILLGNPFDIRRAFDEPGSK